MCSLEKARQGKSALRQIRAQMTAGVLSPAEFDRLMKVAEEGFEQMVPGPVAAPIQRNAFAVIRGDQR
jgi:hypothetical protein